MLLYHWTTIKQAKTALEKDSLKERRWKHFIPELDNLVSGTSWGINKTQWQSNHEVCLILDSEKISNQLFFINGNRTYVRTQGIVNPNFDPNAWQYESKSVDECFIIKSIDNLKNLLLDIEFSSSVSVENKEIINALLKPDKETSEPKKHRRLKM